MGLPAARRLRRRQDFKRVYARGNRLRGRYLTLRALDSGDPAVSTCIGIVVSSKVSKLAVVRNRFKRRLRAAVRHLEPQLREGWRLVVSVRPGSECKYEDLLRELKELLARAKVLHDSREAGDRGAGQATASAGAESQ